MVVLSILSTERQPEQKGIDVPIAKQSLDPEGQAVGEDLTGKWVSFIRMLRKLVVFYLACGIVSNEDVHETSQ